MNLHEVVDIKLLQKVQNSFAEATGFAAITVDFRGNPITQYSNFSSFCNLVRNDTHIGDTCLKCDAYGGFEAARRETPYIYRCHTGLVDFAVPIIVKGQFMGAMLVGQVKLDEANNEKLDDITNQFSVWHDNREMMKEYAKIPIISYEKVSAAAEMMFYVINNMFEKDFMNYVQEELHEKNQQLIEQLKVQADLEKALFDKQIQGIQLRGDPHFLLSAMNTISCLAIIEKAPQTQEVLFTLTEMLKYTLTNSNQHVLLKDELSNIQNYLKIQKLRLSDRFQVYFHIPRELQTLKIPPMILQPVIDNAIIHGIEPTLKSGVINITGYIAEEDMVIEIADNGIGISDEKIKSTFLNKNSLKKENQLQGMGLITINSILISYYGEDYQLSVSRNDDKGTTVRLRIPID